MVSFLKPAAKLNDGMSSEHFYWNVWNHRRFFIQQSLCFQGRGCILYFRINCTAV